MVLISLSSIDWITEASTDISCALERATVPKDLPLFFPQATKTSWQSVAVFKLTVSFLPMV